MLALLAFPSVSPAETATTNGQPADDKSLRRIPGIFDTDLPKTEKKGSIRLILHPHLGDFTSRGYIRVPVGVRWGVNDHVEFSATVQPYVDNGFRRGSPGNGIGDLQFSGKYAFHRWRNSGFDASVGINTRIPVGHPPLDMTDGFNHYAPYLVISQISPNTKGLTYFAGSTLDLMVKSNVAGTFRKNEPHRTSITLSSGFVLDRFPYHYTLEAGYQTTSLVGRDNKQFFFVRPGFAWDLPRRLTFNSNGRWLFGVSLKVTQGPDGTRFDSGGKLRGEFSLRKWMNDRKNGASSDKR